MADGNTLTLEQISQLIQTQSQQIAELSQNHQTLADENAALKTQLAAATETAVPAKKPDLPKIPEELVKVGNKTYKATVARFTLPGIKVDGKGNVIEIGTPAHYLTEEVNAEKSQAILKQVLAIPGQKIYKEIV